MSPDRPAPPLAAHRMLGDGTMTALVRPDTTIDWWCGPALDDEPLLWSLLDPNGARAHFPGASEVEAPRRVAGPVLESVVRIGGQRITLRDGLAVVDGTPVLARLVRGIDGPLDVVHELGIGGFGRPRGRWVQRSASLDGFVVHVGGGEVEADVGEVGGGAGPGAGGAGGAGPGSGGEPGVQRIRLRGERDTWLALTIGLGAEVAPDADRLLDLLRRAERKRDVSLARPLLPRRHRERCSDALAVMVACTWQATGAPVAAPTTSLPEAPGADRQFDYRYTWLRDSSLALSVAALLGAVDVAAPYVDFLATLGVDGILSAPVRSVRGDDVPAERTVPDVGGWRDSRPVRVGNAAGSQVQYDALGFVLDALHVHRQTGGRLHRRTRRIVGALADACCDRPHRPTSGIWELRQPVDLVSADIGRWTALDRAIRLTRGRRPTATRRWRRARADARDRVLAALRPDGCLPQVYGADVPDASSLLLVVLGLLPRRDRRAHRLVDATVTRLGNGAFLHRYPPGPDDGFEGREAAFVPASWWRVSALARLGRTAEADAAADELCAALPQLMPEEWSVEDREGLGNAPLLWSHMEAARALYLLDVAHRRRRSGPLGVGMWRRLRRLRLTLRRRRRTAGRNR